MREKKPLLTFTLLTFLAALALGACSSASGPSQAHSRAPSTSLLARQKICGTRSSPPRTYRHVIWIWLENRSYDQVVGSGSAPYMNRVLIPDCGLATDYHNVTHPSLPNYIAATSGLGYSSLKRFSSDCEPRGSCTTSAPSIFSQVRSWKAYEESMPTNCAKSNSGEYAAKHNPPPYYTSLIGCASRDVPYARLGHDLRTNTLPAFSFITPNLCHDAHSCPLSAADSWLRTQIPKIVRSRAYRSGETVVFITFDEGAEGFGSSDRCASNAGDPGCRVATIVISPYTRPGTRSREPFNHYSLLRTTEQLLGEHRFLGEAAHARSMRGAFGL